MGGVPFPQTSHTFRLQVEFIPKETFNEITTFSIAPIKLKKANGMWKQNPTPPVEPQRAQNNDRTLQRFSTMYLLNLQRTPKFETPFQSSKTQHKI